MPEHGKTIIPGNPSTTPTGKHDDPHPAPDKLGSYNPGPSPADHGLIDIPGNPDIGQGNKTKNLGAQTRRGGGPGGERA